MGIHTLIKLVNRMGYTVSVSQVGKEWTAYIHDPNNHRVVGMPSEHQKTMAEAVAEAIMDLCKGGK